MHKILLALLLFVTLLFPKSEVFAKNVSVCTTETIDTTNPIFRDAAGQCPDDTPTVVYVCYKPANRPNGNASNHCFQLAAPVAPAAAAPGAAVPAAPAPTTTTSNDTPNCKDIPAVKRTNNKVSEVWVGQPCPPNTCFSIGNTPRVGCYALVDTSAAPGLDCSKTNTCTSGGGQRCYLDKDNKVGTPIPVGQVPIAGSKTGIYTAIGCVPTEPKAFVEGLLKYGTVAAGAIAFILMLLGALGMITAEGNPEAIKNSQERFYSAIVGLLLIVFSVLLMQVIGVDILGLPEFGPTK